MKYFSSLFYGLAFILAFSSCNSSEAGQDAPTDATEKIRPAREFPYIKLTNGPKQHWFGYYDKQQVDPTGRYVLAGQVDTFFRSPTARDTLRIGVIDLQNNNRWTELGTTTAWGWQQGCMLQWIPGSTEEIIWNDQQNGKYVSHILNIKTKQKRILPKAIYTLSNDGSFGLGTEFNRIQNMRPGYGYPGIPDPYISEKAPKDIGIYKIDLQTGASQLLISIKDMADIPNLGEDLGNYWHYFNHILIAPDDKRFVFLHRWRRELADRASNATGGFITRMISANMDGSEPYIVDPSGHTSHFIWKNNQELCMWTKPTGKEWGFYIFKDQTEKVEPIGKEIMKANGHNTYVQNTNAEWILNDTYPQGLGRLQELYLYHVPTGKKVSLGKFHEPIEYKGEWRCDLHPKTTQDGRFVIFDSTHEDDGRQIYMIDISKVIKK